MTRGWELNEILLLKHVQSTGYVWANPQIGKAICRHDPTVKEKRKE